MRKASAFTAVTTTVDRLVSTKDKQGHETRYEYNAAGDLTAVITPDGNRSETQYDAWGKAVSTTQGGLTRSMEYDGSGTCHQPDQRERQPYRI